MTNNKKRVEAMTWWNALSDTNKEILVQRNDIECKLHGAKHQWLTGRQIESIYNTEKYYEKKQLEKNKMNIEPLIRIGAIVWFKFGQRICCGAIKNYDYSKKEVTVFNYDAWESISIINFGKILRINEQYFTTDRWTTTIDDKD